MRKFIIVPYPRWYTHFIGMRRQADFISSAFSAYYHSDYQSGSTWAQIGTIENLIWTLKNDSSPFPDRLESALTRLEEILKSDLPLIHKDCNNGKMLVLVVPRAKRDDFYLDSQLLFRRTIGNIVDGMPDLFTNGINYIVRQRHTRTTHLDRSGEGGEGELPYPGITLASCAIDNRIKGANILLIDDVYTEGVNIIEDVYETLMNKGARQVVLYTIGRTVKDSDKAESISINPDGTI